MLTQKKLETLLEIRQADLNGNPNDHQIPNDWALDLLAMLEGMTLRNAILRAENEDLRNALNLKKAV